MNAAAQKTKIQTISPLEQLQRVRSGYLLKDVLIICDKVSNEKITREKIISSATVARYKRKRSDQTHLARELSEKVARVERVWERVLELYKGDEEKARRFFNKPNMMIEDKSPIELILEGESGAVLVNYILDAAQYGFAA